MSDAVIQVGLSNLLLSAALGVLAYAVHRRGHYPALAHMLWVFVLLKVLTPPLFTLPVAVGVGPAGSDTVVAAAGGVAVTTGAAEAAGVSGAVPAWLLDHAVGGLVLAWALGSLLMVTISMLRIRHFGRLVGQTSAAAPAEVQALAGAIAGQLGLKSAPAIYLTGAQLSPMTWWSRGRVRIVLPRALLGEIGAQELRWVLAHELAHIKRRDHLVRWLEWLACVAFWWNPVVWWARRNLRLDEEDACDALVLERLDGQPRSYARILLTVVELLARPRTRAPAVATGIDAAESLERRLKRIVSPVQQRPAPRRLLAGPMVIVLALMTVGIGGAGSPMASADSAGVPAGSEQDRYASLSATLPAAVATTPVAGVLAERPGSSAVDYLGTAGADTFAGSARNEIIVGRAGADRLSGGAGGDIIRGGKGADTIRGGKGADTINGGPGRDLLMGGAGNDVVRSWGDGVADHVDCGSGNADRAIVDSADSTERCEVVVVRDPS